MALLIDRAGVWLASRKQWKRSLCLFSRGGRGNQVRKAFRWPTRAWATDPLRPSSLIASISRNGQDLVCHGVQRTFTERQGRMSAVAKTRTDSYTGDKHG